MSRDYKQAKIYCIKVNTDNEYLPYVGSSCKRLLSQRMNQHRDDYKKWKKNPEKYSFLSSFTLFERFGVQNCFIELIELFPCSCNDELRKKEREHIEKQECCNKVKRVIVTEEEKIENAKIYRDEHKEEIKERNKKYNIEHKDEILQKNKIHYDKHKEEILQKNKEYRDKHKEEIIIKDRIKYHKNKEQINKKKKETYECPCGSMCRKSDKTRHEKTKKHQLFTESTLCATTIA
jgi:hypothetical protein